MGWGTNHMPRRFGPNHDPSRCADPHSGLAGDGCVFRGRQAKLEHLLLGGKHLQEASISVSH